MMGASGNKPLTDNSAQVDQTHDVWSGGIPSAPPTGLARRFTFE